MSAMTPPRTAAAEPGSSASSAPSVVTAGSAEGTWLISSARRAGDSPSPTRRLTNFTSSPAGAYLTAPRAPRGGDQR